MRSSTLERARTVPNPCVILAAGDERDRISLPANGARALEIADLDRDGTNDLVIAHRDNGITSHLDAYLYYWAWGARRVFCEKPEGLPAFSASRVTTGDFNADGWIDIAFACENPVGSGSASTVYWNCPSGFDKRRASNFSTAKLTRLVTIDWNGDGTADVLGLDRQGRPRFSR